MKTFFVEYRLRANDTAGMHAVADSGFGYSQVLPILARGLASGVGSCVIIEQPELHLNPALQIRLAEFLLALGRSGRQVLIETHSEHIVNAVRLSAAEDESGWAHRNTKLYYMHGGAVPQATSLDIRADGTVPDWPREFFGEALSLSTRLLKAQRRFMREGRHQ